MTLEDESHLGHHDRPKGHSEEVRVVDQSTRPQSTVRVPGGRRRHIDYLIKTTL